MMLFNINRIFSCIILVIFLTTNISEGNTSDSLYKKGFQLSIEGKKQNAIEAYLEALKINPNVAEIHHALGVLYFETNFGANAIDHFKKAELLYNERNDKNSILNLTIVKNNLKKAYERLELNPDDFKFDVLLSAKDKWTPSGVGFLVGKDGHLFTSSSSIENAKNIRIRFPNGQIEPVKLIRNFIVYKIAILKLVNPIRDLNHYLTFEGKPNFKEGRPVYAIDFSKLNSEVLSLSKGVILKEHALENSDKIVQISFEINKGGDGGPLLNANGRVIGLILSRRFAQKSFSYLKDSPENASFAIKSSYLKNILSGLIGPKRKTNDQSKELNLKHGINVNKTPKEIIKNFIFLEVYN